MLVRPLIFHFSRRAQLLAQICLALLVLAGCQTDPIVVTPAEQIIGQVVDPQGDPIATKEIDLYLLNKGSLSTQYDSEFTATDGTFTLDFIRHTGVGSDYIVYLPSAYDFPLVGFAIHSQIQVDLVSTALYEMLNSASNNCPVSSFSVGQLDAFLSEARTFVNSQISRNLLQLDISIELLHKAYDNAVSSDPALLNMIQAASILNGTYFNPVVPFPPHNGTGFDVIPSVVGATPKTHTATVNENQTLPLSVSAADYASPPDYIFYSWSIQPVLAADPLNCDNFNDLADGQQTPTEVDLGPEVTMSNTLYNFNYTPAFDTAKWNEPSVAFKIIARASDGGKVSKWIWCTTVVHVERPPVFTTTAPTGAHEDQLWTYTPSATSPDGAPLYLKLVNYPGSPALTGPGVMDMCYNSNFAHLAAGGAPVWKWQNAGTACTTPNQIVWTPDNCESNTPNSIQLSAVDAIGTAGFQTFNVNVSEVNQAPVFTSTAPLFPNPLAAEAIPWSYQILVSDVQADSTTYPGLITGTDPSPYNDLSHGGIPGGVGCPDSMTYSFLVNPPSASIDPHTGLISWTPQDNETGLQQFQVQVSDGHTGGITTQSFTVQTQPTELPPVYGNPAPSGNAPFTVTVNEDLYQTTDFVWSIDAGDPNQIDNNAGKLTVSGTGLPPGATQTWGVLNHTTWTMDWPINDSQIPIGGATYPVVLTLCDTNPLDLPYGGFSAPTYRAWGPPHNHFCVPQTANFQAPKRNFQPQITSNPPSSVVGGTPFTYSMVVSDGNVSPADTFTYAILTTTSLPVNAPVNPPAGMTIVSTGNTAPTGTATVSWNPNNTTDLGSHLVEVSVIDSNAYPGGAHQATQLFSIFVQEHNLAPTITSVCPTTAQDGTLLSYHVIGGNGTTTPFNNRMSYSLISGPSGMAIDAATGILTWTPSVAQAQSPTQSFTVGVTSGGSTPAYPATQQTCTLNMTYVTLPPVFTAMSNVTVPINAPMSTTVIVTDPAGNPITLAASGLPSGASFVDNGNGTGTFTWLPTVTSVTTITFTAQNTYPVNQHLSATPLAWKITVANSPIFQSTPVLSANPAGQYVYEVHVLDPANKGLTFALNTAPGGMSVQTNHTTGITTVTWTPHANDVGSNSVKLTATDGNAATGSQSWSIMVSTGADSGPSINSTTPPYTSTATLTEGMLTNFVMSATELEGYPLHYDWYLDGNWVYDASGTYTFLPSGTAAGNHTLQVNVTDGAQNGTIIFNLHVRDSIPVAGTSYTLPGGHFIQFGLMPFAQEIVTLQGGAGATYSIFPETGFAAGAIGQVTGFSFAPTRMVIENDFAQSNYLLAFFSANNQINAGANTYSEAPSDTLQLSPCSAAVCFNKMFASAYAYFGGTRTPYKQNTLTRFNINPANRSLISSATNGSPNVDASLGAVSASSVIYDPTVNKVFVSVGPSDEVLVVDPATRAVSATIALPIGSYPTALYMNTLTKNLYVYNTGNGSLTEINAQTNAVNSTSTGLPTAPSVGNDPGIIMVGNDADNLLYIADPDTGTFITFDINFGNFKSLQSLGASVVNIDQSTGTVVGASYGNGTIIQLQ